MAVAVSGATRPLLDAADWGALKQICAPLPAKDATTGGGEAK